MMKATIKRLNEEENGILVQLAVKMEEVQAQIDKLEAEESKAMGAVNAIRAKKKVLRAKLVEPAQMRAGIANPTSRDKYFPDYTKATFLEYVGKALK